MAFVSNPLTGLGLGGFSSDALTYFAPESGSVSDSVSLGVDEENGSTDADRSLTRADTLSLYLSEYAMSPSGELTELQLYGSAGQVHIFAAKDETVLFEEDRPETALITFGYTSITIEHSTWDLMNVALVEVANKNLRLEVPRTDSVIPVFRESSVISKSTTVSKAGTDTASISTTDAAVVPVPDEYAVTDTASLTVTDTGSVSVSGLDKTGSDDVYLNVDETSSIDQVIPQYFESLDTASLRVTEVSGATIETLYREIDMEITWPTYSMSIRLR